MNKIVEKNFFNDKERILVMDYDETVREITQKVLTHLGYNVELARDNSEAIDLYRKFHKSDYPFSAVILDIIIYDIVETKKTFEKLLEIDPDVKVIFLSGYLKREIIEDFKEYKTCYFLTKPFKILDIKKILQEVINH